MERGEKFNQRAKKERNKGQFIANVSVSNTETNKIEAFFLFLPVIRTAEQAKVIKNPLRRGVPSPRGRRRG